MRLMLLGAPGAGKGTQASFLMNKFDIPHISTGDMLRQAIKDETALGMEAKSFMDNGQLVPDSVMIGLVKERLSQADVKNGFLLDGFPRTLAQAKALTEANIAFDAIVEITVADEMIVKRITGRRIHPQSGRVYHTEFYPPKVEGVDDESGEPLIQRDDDKAETVLKRLTVYHKDTAPVIDYYKNEVNGNNRYIEISGEGDAKAISNQIYVELTQ